MKAAELIGNIRKAGPNSQALCMQLSGMTDELAGARYARFINKHFSDSGAERFEKKSRKNLGPWAGWKFEELNGKLPNAGKEDIVRIHRRVANFFNMSSKGLIETSRAPYSMNLPRGKEAGELMLWKS